jgi:rhamnose transport system ATP-binding protein
MPLLAADSIRKSFSAVQALRGVSFDLEAGEVHALVGENGAGKSTLIRIMTGAETPDAGTLTVGGRELTALDPGAARALGIAAIYQQPALFPDLTVAENIALALEPTSAFSRVDWNRRRRQAVELLARAGAAIDPDAPASDLSMPQQQLVEIAKALGAEARVVVMDEPTASLADREVDHLFEVIRRLREHGVGVIYISHRLEEVMAIADRITVLRDGRSVGTRARTQVTLAELVAMMVGRELEAVFPKRPLPAGDVVLEVKALTSRAAGVSHVSLEVRRGEILGMAGLVGSGRTEFAEALFGLRPIDSGRVRLNGRPVRVSSPAEAVRLGIGYVPEDRRRHGVIGELPLFANASLATLGSVSRAGLIDDGAERRLAESYMRQLQIKAPSSAVPVGELSGGNQQKVALARWLATRPAVLILDEPTQGVDIGAKAEIHALMQRLVEEGLAVIMISSDLPEVLAMSDRIAVMRTGTIAGLLDRAEATQERVLALAIEGTDAGGRFQAHASR